MEIAISHAWLRKASMRKWHFNADLKEVGRWTSHVAFAYKLPSLNVPELRLCNKSNIDKVDE
jgi:hypothetical protein